MDSKFEFMISDDESNSTSDEDTCICRETSIPSSHLNVCGIRIDSSASDSDSDYSAVEEDIDFLNHNYDSPSKITNSCSSEDEVVEDLKPGKNTNANMEQQSVDTPNLGTRPDHAPLQSNDTQGQNLVMEQEQMEEEEVIEEADLDQSKQYSISDEEDDKTPLNLGNSEKRKILRRLTGPKSFHNKRRRVSCNMESDLPIQPCSEDEDNSLASQLKAFRDDGHGFTPDLLDLFPLFNGKPHTNHPYQKAWRGDSFSPVKSKVEYLEPVPEDIHGVVPPKNSKYLIKGVTRDGAGKLIFLVNRTCQHIQNHVRDNPQSDVSDEQANNTETLLLSFEQARQSCSEAVCDYFKDRIFQAARYVSLSHFRNKVCFMCLFFGSRTHSIPKYIYIHYSFSNFRSLTILALKM